MDMFVSPQPKSSGICDFCFFIGKIPVNTITGQSREENKPSKMSRRESQTKQMSGITGHRNRTECNENIAEDDEIEKLSIVR